MVLNGCVMHYLLDLVQLLILIEKGKEGGGKDGVKGYSYKSLLVGFALRNAPSVKREIKMYNTTIMRIFFMRSIVKLGITVTAYLL